MPNRKRQSAERTKRRRASFPLCVTLRPDVHVRLHKTLADMERQGYRSPVNLQVRDRWRALELAMSEVRGKASLRVLAQRADYYFTIRDAFSEQLIAPAEPRVRYQVQASNRLTFWVPKHLCQRPTSATRRLPIPG